MKLIIDNINKTNTLTACFTGHRPQKLPWSFNEEDPRCKKMKQLTKLKIENSIKNGYHSFLCGMALGFDLICAEIVIDLKKTYPYLKLIGVLPCKNQTNKWETKQKERYASILKQVDIVKCLYDSYIGKKCMFERNRYMIDHSSLVIALFNGKLGGTWQTIGYAQKKGIKIEIIKV